MPCTLLNISFRAWSVNLIKSLLCFWQPLFRCLHERWLRHGQTAPNQANKIQVISTQILTRIVSKVFCKFAKVLVPNLRTSDVNIDAHVPMHQTTMGLVTVPSLMASQISYSSVPPT